MNSYCPVSQEKGVRLPCSHWIDADVAKSCFHDRDSCPVCRQSILSEHEEEASSEVQETGGLLFGLDAALKR